MMDDIARAARTRAPAASSTAGKPPRRATTRRRAMHPTIVINGSNIVAARLFASRRRQVPLRQRDELSARLCHAAGFRPVPRLSGRLLRRLASPRGGKTCPIRSHGTYISRILQRETRGYPSTGGTSLLT